MSPAFSCLSGELSKRSLSRDSSFARLSGVPFIYQNEVFSQALLGFLLIAAWAKLLRTAASWQMMTPARRIRATRLFGRETAIFFGLCQQIHYLAAFPCPVDGFLQHLSLGH
jgi:hypothetical protein